MKARVLSRILSVLLFDRGIESRPAPARTNAGRGNHNAEPAKRTTAGFVVVIVRVAVPVAPLEARLTGDPVIEHVGAPEVGVTLQPKGTFPTNPVEVTVTVAVPVLPRLMVLGLTAATSILNCEGSVWGEYFTTKASPVLPEAVWNAPAVNGKSAEWVWPVT